MGYRKLADLCLCFIASHFFMAKYWHYFSVNVPSLLLHGTSSDFQLSNSCHGVLISIFIDSRISDILIRSSLLI
uniref:Uncharacterized protein n=1 Tax=Populus trichocarpa TaxID=3694 RepID=A0A2K2A2Z4_POPTR